jgi:tetratricopeptide (TPR) repeat protein
VHPYDLASGGLADRMQLDLFFDNRPTILFNIADEHLRKLELEQAVMVCKEILTGTPGDLNASVAKKAAETWLQRLALFNSSPPGIDRIYHLYQNLTESDPAALTYGLRAFMIECLEKEEHPELVFISPRFHIGCLLLEIETPVEAEKWFCRALHAAIAERGRFLAFRGDAFYKAGDLESAREFYLAAFLEDPQSVGCDHLQDRAVRELLIEAEEDGLPRDEAVCWLPAWGWLKGVFSLGKTGREGNQTPLNELPSRGEIHPALAARLWLEDLRHAERLRTEIRDDKESIRVRRRLKELNPELFGRYMEKIRGR